MKRRNLVLGILSAPVLAAAAGAAAWFGLGSDAVGLVEAVVRKRMGEGVRLDDASLRAFAVRYVELLAETKSDKWRVFASLRPVYKSTELLASSPLASYVWWRERDIMHEYLMGTDFFFDQEGYVSGQTPLIYQGPPEPAQLACRNPFANRV